jgi:N-methylhydantoinase B
METGMDPITFEILVHKLWQITAEMGITLCRVTGSPVTIDAKDYIVALFRSDGDLIMCSPGVILHTASIPMGVRHIIARYSENPGVQEGDVFLVNEPYICSLHTADVYIISPLHYRGQLVGWTGSMTHLVDIGGIDPGGRSPRAREIFHEGIRYTGIKIVERGEIRRDVWDSILNMVREPGMAGLEFKGEIAAATVAKLRISELIDRYGLDTYKELCNQVIKYSEAKIRARLLELPDGTWETKQYLDDDGVTDRVYEVALKMTKEGRSLTFDYTGTSEQAPSFVNCTSAALAGGVFSALAVLLGYDIPWSQGLFNSIKIIAPEGTLVNCRFPAPCSMATIAGATLAMNAAQVAISKMLNCSEKYKEDVTAQWGTANAAESIVGIDQRGNVTVTQLMDVCGSGGGARSYADGENTAGIFYVPQTTMPNVETYELMAPILYILRRQLKDSGGAGKFRGGAGGEIWFTLHDAPRGRITLPHWGYGREAAINFGIDGGLPGGCMRWAIKRNTDINKRIERGKIPAKVEGLEGTLEIPRPNGVTELATNDIYAKSWHGGGGYGDPLDRAPESVCRDVINELVSLECAADTYGVVVDAQSLRVDADRTEQKRADIRKARLQTKK